MYRSLISMIFGYDDHVDMLGIAMEITILGCVVALTLVAIYAIWI